MKEHAPPPLRNIQTFRHHLIRSCTRRKRCMRCAPHACQRPPEHALACPGSKGRQSSPLNRRPRRALGFEANMGTACTALCTALPLWHGVRDRALICAVQEGAGNRNGDGRSQLHTRLHPGRRLQMAGALRGWGGVSRVRSRRTAPGDAAGPACGGRGPRAAWGWRRGGGRRGR